MASWFSQHPLLNNPFCLTDLKYHIHYIQNACVFLDFYLDFIFLYLTALSYSQTLLSIINFYYFFNIR